MRKVVAGSRESALAVIQTNFVIDYINKNNSDVLAEILTMKTTGDKILDRKLDEIGGKGLFVKELDIALTEKKSDFSVHSLKDMPMEVSKDLPVLGFSKREDPLDALVLPAGVKEIDFSKPIGCSSRRRIMQLKAIFPEAKFENIRGNVQTRLKKLDAGEYSATVLACAGLKRLGLDNRISRVFTYDEILPAAGQGIICVQGRAGEDYSYLTGYFDESSKAAATAERAFVKYLNGGCTSPVAAHAVIEGDSLTLYGLYFEECSNKTLKGSIKATVKDAYGAGVQLAEYLKNECEISGVIEGEKIPVMPEISYKRGKVFLVGSGPSDAELLTVKANRLIRECDVVVYDALAGSEILSLIPSDKECIDAGKRSGNHTLSQWQTNELLLEKGALGKNVVRLKGGDPFLFGRGGEELELLSEYGIDYEVVPGVTSAISVPAYNGIPVTHRDFTSSIHIVTGHKKAGKEYDIDFNALVNHKGTLVFLMGIAALPDIMNGLLKAKIDPKMPAAVLSRGTTSKQKRFLATVDSIEAAIKDAGDITPAIIVVGKVCALSNEFSWFEKKPLFGQRIVVTRPAGRDSKLKLKLKELGADVIELPSIKTVRFSESEKALNDAIDLELLRIMEYDVIAFTSAYGVDVFFDILREKKIDIRYLLKMQFAAIGEATKAAIEKRGIFVDFMPDKYDGAELGKLLAKELSNKKVLIPRAKIGSDYVVNELSKNNTLKVTDLPIYDTVYETSGVVDIEGEIKRGDITMVTFTSASTVKGFVNMVPDMDYSLINALCIGEQTATEAKKHGMKVTVSAKATINSMIDKAIEIC